MAYFLDPNAQPQPFFRAPPAVFAAVAALVLAHLARDLLPPDLSNEIIYLYGLIPSRYTIDPYGSLIERLVPFVTYMFVHGDWTHVVFNAVWLFVFGAVVVRRWGTARFVLFCLLCGLGAALTYLAFNPDSSAPMIGASGAIAGLMAAGFRMIGADEENLTPLLDRRILIWSAVWSVLNVVMGVIGFGADGSIREIAWQAHLGGYFSGLLLAGLFDRARPRHLMADGA
ncbi:MAG: rhomboid family intramembrane serine protease [Alphaproteobacteria bacterium]|nr:rhomboid family intramembrane serine protease [Alphaproteobacteria bacterium]